MGLCEGDLEKVPVTFTVEQCYARIVHGLKSKGKVYLQEEISKGSTWLRRPLEGIAHLPALRKATMHDIDFVCHMIICGGLEWAYHRADEYGIKMAAYAHHALNLRYQDGWGNDDMLASANQSTLVHLFI